MPEVRKVESQVVDQKCPSCNNGWMRPTGLVNQTTPPSYQHACTICGHKATYGMRFPYNV